MTQSVKSAQHVSLRVPHLDVPYTESMSTGKGPA